MGIAHSRLNFMDIYKKIDVLHLKLGGNIQEFEAGAGLPTNYSDRLSEEINLLLNGCGLFDLKACWMIALRGPDAGTFLQGMVTSDVLQLEVGQIHSSLICGNKGKIQHHLLILRSHSNEWIVICDPGEGRAVGTLLDNFHVREDLKLRLLNNQEMLRMDLIGPYAENILEKMGRDPDNFQWVFEGITVLSTKYDLGGSPRFINLVDIGVIQKYVEKVLKFQNVDLISLEAFDLIRIAEGVPRAGVDYSTENFPQEAALENHISYNKGCYIGQEPHARMYHRGHPNWLSVWLKIPGKSPAAAGSPLFQGGKEIGEITSFGESIKDEGFHRGIAMIRHEIAKEKKLLALAPDQQPFIEHEPLPSNIS